MIENLFLDPFVKAQNWAYHGSVVQSFMQFVFIICQIEGYLKILKQSCRPLASTKNKAFLKKKKKSGTSLSVSFLAWFLKKYLSRYISLTDQISLSGCLYFVRYCVICVL